MNIDLHDGFYLSPYMEGDQPALVEHFSDKKTCDRLLRVPYPYTNDDADKWVQHCVEAERSNGVPHHFACRRPDGYLIGSAGLMLNLAPTSAHRAELGYWIAKDYRGRGLATAAARAVVAFGLRELGLRRIEATSALTNPASLRVLEKAGLEREGRLNSYHNRGGEMVDVFMYAILAPVADEE